LEVSVLEKGAGRQDGDRPAFQRRLRRTLEARKAERRSGDQSAATEDAVRDMAAKGAWTAALVSPGTLTLGDEFQVLLRRASGRLLDLLRISADLYPEQMRFALALGEIDTAINPPAAWTAAPFIAPAPVSISSRRIATGAASMA
jgi:hypothetical protein